MESSNIDRQETGISHLLLATDRAGDGILISNREGTILYTNETFCSLFGLSQEDIVDRDIMEVMESEISPLFEDPKSFSVRIEAVHQKGRDCTGAEWPLRGVGSRWITYSSHLLTGSALQDVRLDIFREISGTRQTEERRARGDDRRKNPVTCRTGRCSCTTGTDLAIITADKQFCDITGTGKTAVRGKDIRKILPGTVASEVDAHLGELSDGHPEIMIPSADGFWKILGTFSPDGALTSVQWTWNGESPVSAGDGPAWAPCLSAIADLCVNGTQETGDVLEKAAHLTLDAAPWCAWVGIEIPGTSAVAAGRRKKKINETIVPIPLEKEDGKLSIEYRADRQAPAGGDTFLHAVAGELGMYLRGQEALEAKRQSEVTYMTLLETTGTATFILDNDGKIVRTNTEFERLFGHAAGDSKKGFSWSSCIDEEDRQMVRQFHELRRTGAEGEIPKSYECRTYTKDGVPRDMIATVSLIPGTQLSIISLIDITEQTETEVELRESEHRYRLITANVTDVIFTLDSDFKFTYVSPSAERLLGWSAGGLLDHQITDGFPGSAGNIFSDAVIEIMAAAERKENGGPVLRVLELETQRPDGEPIWVEVRINPLRADDGVPIGTMGIVRDISERKLAEEREIQYVRELSFLSSAAMGFVELPPEEEIFRYIADHLCGFLDGALVVVSRYDDLNRTLTVRAVSGIDEDRSPHLYSLARGCRGMTASVSPDLLENLEKGVFLPLDKKRPISPSRGSRRNHRRDLCKESRSKRICDRNRTGRRTLRFRDRRT